MAINTVAGHKHTSISRVVILFFSFEEDCRESKYSTKIAQPIPIIKYSRIPCTIWLFIIVRCVG